MSFSDQCPYCEEYIELEENDEHYENYEEYQCPKCEKHFEVFAEPTINYHIRGKAPCLNGEDHKWKKRIGYPTWYLTGKYLCEYCSAEKIVKEEQLSEEEYNKTLVG